MDTIDGGIDLWALAEETLVTPQARTGPTRRSKTRARKRDRAGKWVGAVAVAILLIGIWVLIASSHAAARSISLTVSALAAGAGMGALIMRLRASVYRRLTSSAYALAPLAWWTFLVVSFAFAIVGIAGGLATLPRQSTSDGTPTIAYTAILPSILAVACSAFCTALAPPLVSAARGSRAYRSRWAQVAWTFSLFAFTTSTACAVWILATPTIGQSAITIAAAVLAALFAWHARALAHLREQRRELLSALRGVTSSLGRADVKGAGETLNALRDWIEPNPFRSQSPAAPPPVAGWEIVQVIDLVLHAAGRGPFPETLQSRIELDDGLGLIFDQVRAAAPKAILGAAPAFFERCHNMALHGAVSYDTK